MTVAFLWISRDCPFGHSRADDGLVARHIRALDNTSNNCSPIPSKRFISVCPLWLAAELVVNSGHGGNSGKRGHTVGAILRAGSDVRVLGHLSFIDFRGKFAGQRQLNVTDAFPSS